MSELSVAGWEKADYDRWEQDAKARLKHWVGTKAGKAKAYLKRNRYQEQPIEWALSNSGDPLEGYRDKRGPEFEMSNVGD